MENFCIKPYCLMSLANAETITIAAFLRKKPSSRSGSQAASSATLAAWPVLFGMQPLLLLPLALPQALGFCFVWGFLFGLLFRCCRIPWQKPNLL